MKPSCSGVSVLGDFRLRIQSLYSYWSVQIFYFSMVWTWQAVVFRSLSSCSKLCSKDNFFKKRWQVRAYMYGVWPKVEGEMMRQEEEMRGDLPAQGYVNFTNRRESIV